jgi:hypothetical protein
MDEHDDEDGPPFPLTVAVAGWVWVVHGWVWVLATLALFGFSPESGACVALLTLPAGLRWLIGGQAVLRGEMADPVWGAVVSLLLGTPILALLLVQGSGLPLSIHLALGIPAMSLVTSGLLAIYGRGAYRRWREANPGPRP